MTNLTKGLVVAVFLAILGAPVVTADAPKVTVATKKGDFIDGALRSASPSEVVIEVAGQPITIPTDGVKYLSFVGRIEQTPTSSSASGTAPGTIEDALAALDEIGKAVRVGVLRPQYADLMVAQLPRVMAFLDTPDEDWMDVRLALQAARHEYEGPLRSIEAWSNGSAYITEAGLWVLYAKWIREQPDARTHREAPFKGQLQLDTPVEGRLGFGDSKLPAELARYAELPSAPAEAYEIDLPQPGKLTLEVTSPTPGHPSLVVIDSFGKVLDSDSSGRLKKDLKATGHHTVWVVGNPVGTYKLTANFSPKR